MLQVKYVPNTIDIDIKSRLNTLKENLISINSNSNNNNNNNNNFLPPRPPSSPLPSLHKQDNFFSIFFSTTSNNSLTKLFWTSTKNTTTTPSAPQLPPTDHFLINTKFGKNVIEKREKVIEHIDNALNEVPEPTEIEPGDALINLLSAKADDHFVALSFLRCFISIIIYFQLFVLLFYNSIVLSYLFLLL